MIVLTVQSFNGQPVAGLSASFDELGGNIGRADTNQLVLADPDRSVSRLHAQLVFRHGGYVLVDRGSNAVLVNDQPVGHGREVPLHDGDTLAIGGYLIRASLPARGATPARGAPAFNQPAADPFADPFSALPPAASPPPPAWPAADGGSAARALFGDAPAIPPAPPARHGHAATNAAAPPTLPDDWDPFAPPAQAPSSPAAGWNLAPQAGTAAAAMSAPTRSDSLDALFDLGFNNPSDPFAGTPAAAPLVKPNTQADKDPMQAFGLSAPPVAAAVPDHLSDLNTPWQGPSLAAPRSNPAAPAPPQGAVLSWQQTSRDGKLVTLPGRPVAAPADATLRPPDMPPTMPPPTTPAAATTDAWAQALADGLGMPVDRLGALDADQLRLIGQLLREATGGVVALLVARAALKREMRTDVTMIGSTENNALKFSPHVDVALQHLLGPPMTGFMPPAQAMRDAFDDLRAHQLGVMAGMRAALDGVLARFEPTQLESKIAARRTALATLMPSTRKAQLWEQFQQLYAQLSVEATDDFQALFGQAFSKAYKAHIDALQDRSD